MALLPLTSWTCSENPASGTQTQRRDSAGVTLVESAGFPAEGAGGWTLSQEPALEIGTLEGDTLYQLFQVTSGALLDDGTILVTDNGSFQLRIFSPDGTFLRSMGQQGEGPGEFKSMEIMGTLGPDTVVLLDGSQRRISFFHLRDGFLSQANVQDEVGVTYFANGMFQDGSVVFGGGLLTGPGSALPQEGYSREPTTYQSVDRQGRIATEFGEFPGMEVYFQFQGGGGERMISARMPTFGKRPRAAARGIRLVLGSGDSYELKVFDPLGRNTRIIRLASPSLPVTQEHLDAYLEEQLEALDDPAMAARVRSSFPDRPHADVFPAYGSLHLDAEGFLWVEDYTLPGATRRGWTVFDPEGRPVTRLSLPSENEILDIGSRQVLTLFEDELGVEYLAVFHLDRGKTTTDPQST